MTLFNLLAVTVVLFYSSIVAASTETITIRACGDGGEWPPYTYFQREEGKVTHNVIGFDVDVLEAIFKGEGLSLQMELIHWRRCLKLAAIGEVYQISISASQNKERIANFFFSHSHYELTGYYYYLNKKYPEGPAIKKPADLAKYRLCGLDSYDYSNFGIKNTDVDMGSDNYQSLVNKTKHGRCDIFLARTEIIEGFKQLGINYLDDSISSKAIPEIENNRFYIMVSKKYVGAKGLIEVLNKGITRLRRSGELSYMMSKYDN